MFKLAGYKEIKKVKQAAEAIIIEEMDDGPCVVMTGSIFAGDVRIWGPFRNSVAAEEFIKDSVSPALNPDWTYLEEPPVFTPMEVATVSQPTEKQLLEFPASQTILNNKGKVIGVQGVIPDSV